MGQAIRLPSNFSEIFIRRPVATSLLMLAVALFGVISYRALQVADLPTVDFPTISISASLPGASPATVASRRPILEARSIIQRESLDRIIPADRVVAG